jgi:hypothetical protein
MGVTTGLLLVVLSACNDSTAPAPTPLVDERASILQMQLRFLPTGQHRLSDSSLQTVRTAHTIRWMPEPRANDIVPPDVIVAPDTVFAGLTFRVQLRTILPSTCVRATRLSATQSASLLELQPFDAFDPSAVCTSTLVYATRFASATMTTPGVATIRVRGRRAGIVASDTEEVIVERQVVVLPRRTG